MFEQLCFTSSHYKSGFRTFFGNNINPITAKLFKNDQTNPLLIMLFTKCKFLAPSLTLFIIQPVKQS